jgi:hypothetical protein
VSGGAGGSDAGTSIDRRPLALETAGTLGDPVAAAASASRRAASLAACARSYSATFSSRSVAPAAPSGSVLIAALLARTTFG